MEPPSLTREPRCPFCMVAVEDILPQFCIRRRQGRLRKSGPPSLVAPLTWLALSVWRSSTAHARMLTAYRRRPMTKRMAVLALAVCLTIHGFAEKGFAQKGKKVSAG